MKVELSIEEIKILLAYIDHAVKSAGISQAQNGLILTNRLKAVLPKEPKKEVKEDKKK